MTTALSLPIRMLPVAVSGAAHAALIAALIVAGPFAPNHPAAGDTVIELALVDEIPGGAAFITPPALSEPEPVSLDIAPPEPPAALDLPVQKVAPDVSQPEPDIALPANPTEPQKAEAPPVLAQPEPMPLAHPKPVARPRPTRSEKWLKENHHAETTRAARPAQPGPGAGHQAGGTPGNAASGAAYAGRVRAILQGRANALGIEDHEGQVAVSFVIGASGRIETHAIIRTSGSASVDRLIRGMMASAAFPAPPGGRFSGQVTIRIQ